MVKQEHLIFQHSKFDLILARKVWDNSVVAFSFAVKYISLLIHHLFWNDCPLHSYSIKSLIFYQQTVPSPANKRARAERRFCASLHGSTMYSICRGLSSFAERHENRRIGFLLTHKAIMMINQGAIPNYLPAGIFLASSHRKK